MPSLAGRGDALPVTRAQVNRLRGAVQRGETVRLCLNGSERVLALGSLQNVLDTLNDRGVGVPAFTIEDRPADNGAAVPIALWI